MMLVVPFYVSPQTHDRHEILSGGKRGLSAPYGEHWRRWRKVNIFIFIIPEMAN
jgi:hypothetical protein